VERKAGWDTHGLPVEIEIEKELGLKNKKDIETYGVVKFNEKCRQSVWKYKQEWDALTERIGYWMDLEHPYITYDPLYMEALWRIVKRVHEKGLLYEGHKVVPYCPRCGTSISSHEVALGYEDVREDSVFVKFKVKGSRLKNTKLTEILNLKPGIYFLAWTTTPWTLPGNVALAVGEKIDYVLVKQDREYYIVAKERATVLEGEYKIVKKFKGKDLQGIEYEPLYTSLKEQSEKKSRKTTRHDRHYVALADFVRTEEGTGIVHTAVMYGEDDYTLGQKLGLPKIHTVDEGGRFNRLVPQWEGEFVKDAEPKIIADLKARNLLYKKEAYTHSYPFCWRCKTPLLYYAMRSWFIKMSVLRKSLIDNNSRINWVPRHIKEGRFGEWLREVKDWNFSRNRYWGTPLPVWKCAKCGNYEVIGSREDLGSQNFSSNTFYVLRHGEAEKNVANIISSRIPEKKKFRLTQKGKEQAMGVARQLEKLGGIDYILSSDFTRAKETAEIIAKEVGLLVRYDKRLREYNLGVYDGRLEQDFSRDFPDIEARFQKGPESGETSARLQQRMFEFVVSSNKKYKNKKILIVSHGDPLWLLESRLLGLTIEETVEREKSDYPKVGQLRSVTFKQFPYNMTGELDLHRPYVDEVRYQCKHCKDSSCDSMQRVEELIDVWFDSGSMPFAQSYWPLGQTPNAKSQTTIRDKRLAPSLFPADYICEAIDQTRGWFYTLLAVSTLLGFESPYKNVISLAHVLDKHGKKMSKSLGNTVDPWTMIEKYGSDALRWYFYTVNQPGDPKNFDETDLQKTYRKFISTLWNTLVFYKTYSRGKGEKNSSFKFQVLSFLDRWILSRLSSVTAEVTKRLDAYDITAAARALESFVIDDLSNWYVRRSRKRFQTPESAKEKEEAEQVLGYVILEVSKLSAPFTPFLSEQIYQEVGFTDHNSRSQSVHWTDFPESSAKQINKRVEKDMEKARRVVKDAHELRARESIRVRQPVSKFQTIVKLSSEAVKIVADEVNAKEIIFTKNPDQGDGWATIVVGGVTTTAMVKEIPPDLKEEGFINEFTRHVQDLRKAAGLIPSDKIELRYSTDPTLAMGIRRRQQYVEKQNNTSKILESADAKGAVKAESEFEWEGKKVWIGLRKAKGSRTRTESA